MTPRRSATSRAPITEAKARLSAHLERTHCKHSRTRDAVVDAFLETPGHLSIGELTAMARGRAPGVGYTTVYRALKLLEECGLAAAREFGNGHTRYERVMEAGHHDHLICTRCGAIAEFEDPSIEEMQDEVARRYGFRIASHKMELYGLCGGCVADRRRAATQTRPITRTQDPRRDLGASK